MRPLLLSVLLLLRRSRDSRRPPLLLVLRLLVISHLSFYSENVTTTDHADEQPQHYERSQPPAPQYAQPHTAQQPEQAPREHNQPVSRLVVRLLSLLHGLLLGPLLRRIMRLLRTGVRTRSIDPLLVGLAVPLLPLNGGRPMHQTPKLFTVTQVPRQEGETPRATYTTVFATCTPHSTF